MKKNAVISDCTKYQYSLERIWDENQPLIGFIGLNPSTADANIDDNTIHRCIAFAKGIGGGGLIMVNLFAFIATEPRDMMNAQEPIGSKNDEFLLDFVSKAAKIIAC